MALSPDQRLISADDHMDIYVLPKDLWESRLPAKYRDAGPRVVETDDGPHGETVDRILAALRHRAEEQTRHRAEPQAP